MVEALVFPARRFLEELVSSGLGVIFLAVPATLPFGVRPLSRFDFLAFPPVFGLETEVTGDDRGEVGCILPSIEAGISTWRGIHVPPFLPPPIGFLNSSSIRVLDNPLCPKAAFFDDEVEPLVPPDSSFIGSSFTSAFLRFLD